MQNWVVFTLVLIWLALILVGVIITDRPTKDRGLDSLPVPPPVPVLPCPACHPHRATRHCNGDQPDRPADFDD